jgi:dihydrofolate reductase
MSQLIVSSFSVSIDGYGAGPAQSLEDPLGKGGLALHEWALATRTFRKVFGEEGGSTDRDDEFAARGVEAIGAWILGRNMFGPIRGPWPDESWRGWWGEEPPYHVPVFVLTHHPRAPLVMPGGTTFHFVTDGIDAALRQAREAAGDRDVRLGGGVATIRQYLHEGLVDRMHIAIAPVVLGAGEPLFHGMDMRSLGFEIVEHVPTARATHVVFAKVR